MKTNSYLDYNATCPIRPSVIEKVAHVMTEVGNPSSVHSAGRKARGFVEEARVKIAALAGSRPRDVMFCSGGTEANNTVLHGSGAKSLIISTIEHDCVLAAAKTADVEVYKLPVKQNGVVDTSELIKLLEEAPKPALVSVMLANNEMGVIQPVSEISSIAKAHGALVHTDAVQAAGKIMIDQEALGVDYLTLSSHKIGGPQGVGAIVLAPTAPLKPLVVGGGQELGRRSGTENVAGCAGFGEAAIEALSELGNCEKLQILRDKIDTSVREYSNKAVIIGADAERLANTSCIAMPGVKGETQVMHFDLASICVSSGSACSSGKVKVSHVLSAMGHDDDVAESSVRVSLGYKTTEEEVEHFISAWKALHDRTIGRA